MGENPAQLERYIEQNRSELDDNLSELQEKMKDAVDWRAQFQKHPMAMLGVAVGGGILLSMMFGKKRSASPKSSNIPWASGEKSASRDSSWSEAASAGFSQVKRKSSDLLENIKDAVVGLTATRAAEYLDHLVPGFQEHYRKAATERKASRANGHDQEAAEASRTSAIH